MPPQRITGRSGSETWSDNYVKTSKSLALKHRASTKKLMLVKDPTGQAVIVKDAGKIVSVNAYKIQRSLGKGAFGEVFLAKHLSECYAIKVLRKSTLKKTAKPAAGPGGAPPVLWGGSRTIAAMDSVKAEIATMKKIEHPNCVHYYDVILDPACDEVFLVLEFVDGGPSQKHDASGHPIPLDEAVIWSHLRHLCMGLEYLHYQGIIHRDIKPENLLITSPHSSRNAGGEGALEGELGVLKIADFGTSCLCAGDANAAKTAGTPAFFSPELCAVDTSVAYDGRIVDLWAVGITLYLWVSGRVPFFEPTTAQLLQAIADAPECTTAPPEASAGLSGIIEGLLTRQAMHRLTLVQLRLHKWLTVDGSQLLPPQPIMKIQVSAEEIEQAFSNRKAVAVGSAAGPSALGKALSFVSRAREATNDSGSFQSKGASAGWTREGDSTIRKRSTAAEARFYRAIGASGELAPHIPVTYMIEPVDEGGASTTSTGARDASADESTAEADGAGVDESKMASARLSSFTTAGGVDDLSLTQPWDIVMQDLVADMTRPCAMAMIMGTRTVTAAECDDADHATPRADLLELVDDIDPAVVSEGERAAGGISSKRYLQLLDELSSTACLGFRIDGAKTVVNGKLDMLPLPEHVTLHTLREEADVITAVSSFVQKDEAVAAEFLLKLQTFAAALEHSVFFARHAFLRSTMLCVYDDANRTSKLRMKIMNFSSSYELPEGHQISHTQPWEEGASSSHEDGYLIGVRSLLRVFSVVAGQGGGAEMQTGV